LLLSIALILVVNTTIKLLNLNRRQEIEITKLVGGSNSFVRRPFLYFGFFFGLFGAALALALLYLVAALLAPSLTELATLYQQETLLYQPHWWELLSLLLGGGGLGWLAARLSVAQHLGQIRPR
jgi:cell division transport system permease protein